MASVRLSCGWGQVRCSARSKSEIRQSYLETTERYGRGVVSVGGDRRTLPFAYTVGLTRYHDHPELVVSGVEGTDAATTLNALAEHLRDGHRYAAGDVVESFSPNRYQLLRVNDATRLVIAQEIYPRWADRRSRQELFGRPPRAAA